MSPELETLEQLLGGTMPLAVLRRLYPDDRTFAHSIHAMLRHGDVRLLSGDGEEVPGWRWRDLFVEGNADRNHLPLKLSLTEQGMRRVV